MVVPVVWYELQHRNVLNPSVDDRGGSQPGPDTGRYPGQVQMGQGFPGQVQMGGTPKSR